MASAAPDQRRARLIGQWGDAAKPDEFRGRGRPPPELVGLTLERLLTDPQMGALRASPAQRALARAADGRPVNDVLTPEKTMFHFGCSELPANDCVPPAPCPPNEALASRDAGPVPGQVRERPGTIVVRTGVRAGKSLISAMALLHSILFCKFRRPPEEGEVADADGMVGVRPGEMVRALIVAPLLKLSRAPFHHLVGTMLASPILSKLLVGKPGTESCRIRRPDGFEVEVELVAASSGGLNLRSTWLAGLILDEADFHDDKDAAVNLGDNYRAAVTRMLADAQIWIPSSPWADSGPFHELFTEAFGFPGGMPGSMLSFHSDSRSMNPTVSRKAENDERRRDPDNAAREYDAIPLSANSPAWFPEAIMKIAFNPDRETQLMPVVGLEHKAGTDLGFRKNSSALALARPWAGKVQLAYYEELRPQKGSPLKPSEVCATFGETMVRYRAGMVRGDHWYVDTATEEFGKLEGADGETLRYQAWQPSTEAQTEAFTEFRRLIAEGLIDLPDDPRLRLQMKGTTTRMNNGKVQVRLPKQGRAHGDLLMAVVLACIQVATGAPVVDEAPDTSSFEEYRFGTERGFG